MQCLNEEASTTWGASVMRKKFAVFRKLRLVLSLLALYMTHNTELPLESIVSTTSTSKPVLGVLTLHNVLILFVCTCLLAVSTGFYYDDPTGIKLESILLCVLPHLIVYLSYMSCTSRSLCLDTIIPLLSGVALTAVLSCLLTLTQIDEILLFFTTEGSVAHTIIFSFLRAATIEEAGKLFIALDARRRSDVLFSGIVGAIGFAAAENLQYLIVQEATLHQVLARLITANVVHVCCTAIIVLLGQRLQSRVGWITAFSLGVLFHGLYDFFVLSQMPLPTIVVVQVMMIAAASLAVLSDDDKEADSTKEVLNP